MRLIVRLRIILAGIAATVMSLLPGVAIGAGAANAGAASADAVIARAERAMGANQVRSLRFAGNGSGATVGQAFEPGKVWPKVTISTFSRAYDYVNAAMREDSARSRAEPTGGGAVPLMGIGEQRQSGFVQGKYAWNMINNNAVAAPVALETRQHDLWTSPHGVLLAAKRNNASVRFTQEAGKSLALVSFTEPGVMNATASVDDDAMVVRVESSHPHPVTGDISVVTQYSDYRDHNGVKFPGRIRQSYGGFASLDLEVKEVQINPSVEIAVTETVRNFAERVAAQQVAPGVWFLAGGSHNSVVIEMKDHLVVVEAPLYDGRTAAVLAEAKKLAPGKPIRTVINSHHHFDHAGGLRAAAAEGASLLVTANAKSYFEKTLASPSRIKPDLLAKSGKKAKLIGYAGKTTLHDGSRTIEIHSIADSVHSNGFTMVYLPAEKLLIEGDAYTPAAPGTPPPAKPNDNNVNLADNIERLKLTVERILPLHGSVVPLSHLYTAIGRKM